MADDSGARLPWWLAGIVVLGALGLTSLAVGGVVAPRTLVPAGEPVTEAARIWGRYAACFSVSLAAVVPYLLVRGSGRPPAAVLVQAALAQLLLAVVAAVDRRWAQIPANVVLLAAFLGSARYLTGHMPRAR